MKKEHQIILAGILRWLAVRVSMWSVKLHTVANILDPIVRVPYGAGWALVPQSHKLAQYAAHKAAEARNN